MVTLPPPQSNPPRCITPKLGSWGKLNKSLPASNLHIRLWSVLHGNGHLKKKNLAVTMGYEQGVEVADHLASRVEETHTGEFGTKRDLVS